MTADIVWTPPGESRALARSKSSDAPASAASASSARVILFVLSHMIQLSGHLVYKELRFNRGSHD